MSPSPNPPAIVVHTMESQIAEKQRELEAADERFERSRIKHEESTSELRNEILELRIALCQLTQGVSRAEALKRFRGNGLAPRKAPTVDKALEFIQSQGDQPFTRGELMEGAGGRADNTSGAERLANELLAAGVIAVVQEGMAPSPGVASKPWIFKGVTS